ncbi:DinB family protein [Flavihumibacter sp.]|uniref:DinB family protein n=1 Tax=Flavihumibacter sp. TaxID=1913981 RepID=UPI002FCBC229|nr:DinB family protein [Flavihumibacter sediminis]
MTFKKLMATVCLLLSISLFAQSQSSLEDMVKDWERSKAYTKEYLDAMSDADYALKPTPEMRSFADQMLHITDANFGFMSAITGVASPVAFGEAEKAKDKSKAAVTKMVMDSYDFVIKNLPSITAAQMNEKMKFFDRFEITKASALAKMLEHQAHHRGQTTVYLRLAKVTPPQEKLF